MKYDLDSVNNSFKERAKARTSPSMTTRPGRDEIRIKHVITSSQRKAIDFAKLSEKLNATLEVARAISAKTTGLRKHFKLTNSLKQFDELRNQLTALVSTLTSLKLKLS
jgi:hypothetical protein